MLDGVCKTDALRTIIAMAELLFNFFAAFTLVCALGVVVNKNTVNAAMCLLLSLVGVAGLFVALNAYLLAFLLLLVYAGAVVALFLFIIMLLDTRGDQRPGIRKLSLFVRVLALGLVAAGLASFVARGQLPAPAPGPAPAALGAELKLYAYQLFTTYLLPVQILGFLLLAAMLGVIVLSKKFEAGEDAK
jgi:NADH-quinone oxidoreductase subunit J